MKSTDDMQTTCRATCHRHITRRFRLKPEKESRVPKWPKKSEGGCYANRDKKVICLRQRQLKHFF